MGRIGNLESGDNVEHASPTSKEIEKPKIPSETDKGKLEYSKKPKRQIQGVSDRTKNENFRMNSPATIYAMGEKMDPKSQEFYTKALYSGANPKVKLIGRGQEFYKTGDKSSGNFLTEEHPGTNERERKENLQVPKSNDAKDVYKVRSTRPQIGIQSDIVPQPEWAKESGYTARPGMKQIYTPNTNPDGAIADKRYEVLGKVKDTK